MGMAQVNPVESGVRNDPGQNQRPDCSWASDRTPELFGLHLGMTLDEVCVRFPGIKVEKQDEWNVRDVFFFCVGSNTWEESLPDVFAVEMVFLYNQLVKFRIKFSDSPRWPKPDDFTFAVAELAGLKGILNPYSTRIQCANVEVRVWEDSSRAIVFENLEVSELLDYRVEESYAPKRPSRKTP
jgi:hypothetical protein